MYWILPSWTLLTVSNEPFLPDSDGDGCSTNRKKHSGQIPTILTRTRYPQGWGRIYNIWLDPTIPDTDGDVVSNSVEMGLGEDPAVATAYGLDADNDGIPDDYELQTQSPDSDSDGWWDGFRVP